MATLAVFALDEFADIPATDRAWDQSVDLAGEHPHVPRDSAVLPSAVFERSTYQPSKGSRAVALLASTGAILGIVAAMATLNIVAAHKPQAHLTTVDIHELDITPPPPPPEPTKLDTPAAKIQTVAPKPMIELPSQGPVQVMVDVPPPPAPPVAASEGVKVGAPPAVAPAPSTTLEGGDLSSKVLFAKPPTYPTESRRAREQGTVKLLVLVGTDGAVKDIQVAGSSGSQRLDRAALAAVKRWRWSPMMSGGTAMAVRGYVTIPFVLVSA
ncbi:energy transducer TonB [Novosphingobium sp. BL-52-GroH]|uniref:energy transducer TonB n=1 Tax=Novosphingobium sp. BL-52-GroH TaxID=3349877 RepID=UPI00384E3D74